MNITRISLPAVPRAVAHPGAKTGANPGAKPGANPGAKPGDAAKITKAAQDFTATALNELLTPLFQSLPQDGGLFGGGAGEAAWRPMMVQEMASAMARNGGLGITTLVEQAMLRLQETAK